jgi:hypothetical protein
MAEVRTEVEGTVDNLSKRKLARQGSVARMLHYDSLRRKTVMGLTTLFRLGVFATVAALFTACTVETYGTSYAGGEPVLEDAGAPDASEVFGGSPDPSSKPMLARVELNKKMIATPGVGVGVFTEYYSGGQWHVWWTCDTNLSHETCPFDIKISVEKGAITDPTSEGFGSIDTLTTPAMPGPGEAGGIAAKTVTTNGVQGVHFDTEPGATITLTATIGGLYYGRFLFWVQSGNVNGGYTGAVTDPLMLVGVSP